MSRVGDAKSDSSDPLNSLTLAKSRHSYAYEVKREDWGNFFWHENDIKCGKLPKHMSISQRITTS